MSPTLGLDWILQLVEDIRLSHNARVDALVNREILRILDQYTLVSHRLIIDCLAQIFILLGYIYLWSLADYFISAFASNLKLW